MTPPHDQTLAVLIEGREAGTLREDAAGRYELIYDNEWQVDDAATPVSLSMATSSSARSSVAFCPTTST